MPASKHWDGMLQQTSSPSIRLMYLAGEAKVGGWWWYFPFAFLVKNPIPLLMIWGGAIVIAAYRRALTPLDVLFLLVFPIVYAAAAMYSKMNIGYRHLLPIHPFLYVFAAQWVDWGASPGTLGERGQRPGTAIRNRPYRTAMPLGSQNASASSNGLGHSATEWRNMLLSRRFALDVAHILCLTSQ